MLCTITSGFLVFSIFNKCPCVTTVPRRASNVRRISSVVAHPCLRFGPSHPVNILHRLACFLLLGYAKIEQHVGDFHAGILAFWPSDPKDGAYE